MDKWVLSPNPFMTHLIAIPNCTSGLVCRGLGFWGSKEGELWGFVKFQRFNFCKGQDGIFVLHRAVLLLIGLGFINIIYTMMLVAVDYSIFLE